MAKTFGHIPGFPVGSLFPRRTELRLAGLHAPNMHGISGNPREGADSIVVSGGYVDDEDHGSWILYTGHGGRDNDTKHQVANQEITDTGNAGLVKSQLEGLPVRVIRGAGGDPHYSPESGFRYDGLFRVESHGSKIGVDGFRIWQFRMVQIDENDPSPDADVATFPPTAPAGGTPSRKPVQTQRIVRNTAVAQWVKELHKHMCQICGDALEVDYGFYSEGAHIQGLGKPYNGPDVVGNVLCLCPNDHVRFDNGALYLTDDLKVINALNGQVQGQLRVHAKHNIDLTYVQHHRARWGQ